MHAQHIEENKNFEAIVILCIKWNSENSWMELAFQRQHITFGININVMITSKKRANTNNGNLSKDDHPPDIKRTSSPSSNCYRRKRSLKSTKREGMISRFLAPWTSSSSFSRTLFLSVLLNLISRQSALTGTSSSIDSNTCDSSSPDSPLTSNKTDSPFFDSFLEAYGETVDTIVGLQTTTWNYLPRYHSFDESKAEGFCDEVHTRYLSSNVPKFARRWKESSKEVGSTNATKTEGSSNGIHETSELFRAWSLSSGVRYDREADIDGYFANLAEGCTKDIPDELAANRFKLECLDELKNIVYEPKCTTRFDSRVVCDGAAPPTLLSPSEVIRDHFGRSSSDEISLHVVIIGAGPIGLMLGNALSMLQKRQRVEGSIPPIKILYLDTRAEAPGVKKLYSRNWQAHLSLLHLRHIVDPRLIYILASMTVAKDDPEWGVGGFVSPLNVIETLLLLSNRDMGNSRFLFGINPLEIVEDLKKIPNLVLVDATGHRIEPLRRGPVCDGSVRDEGGDTNRDVCEGEEHTILPNHRTPSVPAIPWMNVENYAFYKGLETFNLDFTMLHDFLEDRGQHLHLGRSGDMIYPIDETTKVAKSMWWLDIHGAMPLTQEGFWEEEANYAEGLYASEGPLCQWCKGWFEEKGVDRPGYKPESYGEMMTNQKCNIMCYTTYHAQSTALLREDINRNIFNGKFTDTFVYHTDSWFPIMGYSFNPSIELAQEAQKVLSDHGLSNHPTGMPLKDFYPAMMRTIENSEAELSVEDFQLIDALRRYSLQSNATKWPSVTMYVQQPFIYTNGIKKKNRCGGKFSASIGDHLEHAPEIRFGDSFTIGDGLSE